MNSPPAGHLREAARMVTAATTDGTFEVGTPISGSASGDRWVFRIGGWAAHGRDDESASPQAARAASRGRARQHMPDEQPDGGRRHRQVTKW